METTPETFSSTLASIVRMALGGLAFEISKRGWVTASQSEFLIQQAIAAAIAGAAILWAWFKNRTQIKTVMAALHAPAGTPLEAVKLQVADPSLSIREATAQVATTKD
jgi:hypothetical protein